MTTIKLLGGDMGRETMLVRCDLTRAEAVVVVQFRGGDGWQPTQYQAADARHTAYGLADLGRRLAAHALGHAGGEFTCAATKVE
jgi:hypothetical protein